MFSTKNVAVHFAGARFNRTELDDDEEITIVECNLVIEPWPFALLQELGDDAAAHVFLKDGRVKPELKTVTIRPTYGRLQRFQFASALDVKPEASIEPVVVEHLQFQRRTNDQKGSVWVKGVIRADLEYRDKAVRQLLATAFGARVFLSTIGLEGRLNFDAPPTPRLVERAPGGEAEDGVAPAPDPEAGDVLDEQEHGARTSLHTGRKKPGAPDVH